MPCYHPLKGYRGRKVNPDTGKRPVVFNHREGFHDLPVELPCGRCIGCRLERSRQWAMRCVHEASLYPQNSFITLTFREACPLMHYAGRGLRRLPKEKLVDPTHSLHHFHFQDFMKRLRKHYAENIWSPKYRSWYPRKKIITPTIRDFHCGEYGEKMGRPHHHACLFGINFPDKILWQTRDGVKLYRSATLENLWPYGHSTIGDVTFESAAYVARYVTKKITGDQAATHYGDRKPEYCSQSRRPGLGKGWLQKYTEYTLQNDFIIIRGKKSKIPKYYDKILEISHPQEFLNNHAARIQKARNNPNNHPDRLAAGEAIQKTRFAMLKRGYEST